MRTAYIFVRLTIRTVLLLKVLNGRDEKLYYLKSSSFQILLN